MSSSRFFVDTNVFAYALDRTECAKQEEAQQVIDRHRGDLVVSTQVLLELYAVCTRKLGMQRADARRAVEAITGFPVIDADRQLIQSALKLAELAQISIFDATIVCAAQRAGCDTVLSEDLNAEQRYNGVVVENPFLA